MIIWLHDYIHLSKCINIYAKYYWILLVVKEATLKLIEKILESRARIVDLTIIRMDVAGLNFRIYLYSTQLEGLKITIWLGDF